MKSLEAENADILSLSISSSVEFDLLNVCHRNDDIPTSNIKYTEIIEKTSISPPAIHPKMDMAFSASAISTSAGP